MEHPEVFISYHTQTGAQAVQEIVSVLESRGISCWYAPRNVGANYAQSIVEAIRGCRVFLLVLNERSNTSAHVLNEINCAFDRFKEHEDIVLLPFRIDGCHLSDDIYYYLGRIHIMDGVLPPEEIRVQELAGRVSALLGKKSVRTGECSASLLDISPSAPERDTQEKKTYRLIGSMVYPDNSFVGRRRELEQMAQCLDGVENKVFLVGMGGIGKSEIARMYLKEYVDRYDVILWTSFDRTLAGTLANDSLFAIQGMSRGDYPEDDDETYFNRKLHILKEISDRKVLIVIDNFDVTDDPHLEAFCSGPYSVIFTTRYHQQNGHIGQIDIGKMESEEELLSLFGAEYTRALSGEALEQVKKILKHLEGHPLSIRLVASTMQSRRISPEKMLALLEKGALAARQENATAANMIFGQLRQVFQLSTLSEEEVFLLKNLSLVPLSGITVEQFFDWCGTDHFEVIDGLIDKSWVIHNPITDEVHLHPLVCDLMQEELARDPESCTSYIHSLQAASQDTFNITWEEKRKLLDYARAASDRIPDVPALKEKIWMACASMLADFFAYEESIRMYRKALDGTQDTTLRTRLYHHISHMQIISGYPEQGCETAAQGLRELEGIPLSQMSLEMGYYRNELLRRMSESNRALGNYDTAIRYAREAVATCQGFYFSTQQSATGWALYHLARSLFESGELKESEDTIRQAYGLFQEIDNTWSIEHCYELLGQILMKKGQFEEALRYTREALDIRHRLAGSDLDMPNLAYQGNIYRAAGQEEKAQEYFRQAAEGYHKCGCFKLEEKVRNYMEYGN